MTITILALAGVALCSQSGEPRFEGDGRPFPGSRILNGPSWMGPDRSDFGRGAVTSVMSAGALTQPPSRPVDVIYIPTPAEVVTAMLQMAHVGNTDVVYDLGSGDGRIVIAAVKEFGAARGVGIELDAARVQEAKALARQAGVSDRVEFRQQDLFESDLREASVVTLYLQNAVNLRLRPKLQAELKPGTRVVSHAFDMGDWAPDETRSISGRLIFLWTVR